MGKPEAVLVEETFNALARGGWPSFVANRLSLPRLPGEVLEAIRGYASVWPGWRPAP